MRNSGRKIQLFLLVLLSVVSEIEGNSQPMIPSGRQLGMTQTEIPTRLKRKFLRDAARLALRLSSQEDDLRYQSIVIPQGSIQNFYKLLSSIYLFDDTAKSISKCNVHTFPSPSIDHFVVIFDKTVEWAAPLRRGISETNSNEINDLLDEFDLIIEKYVQWNDNSDAITIRSKEPLNMAALSNEFYNVEGVSEVDLGIPGVSGNDIQVHRVQGGWEVDYILRFGSHLNGKGSAHIWKYQVTDDGRVSFHSETGEPVPAWMRCYFEPDHFLEARL